MTNGHLRAVRRTAPACPATIALAGAAALLWTAGVLHAQDPETLGAVSDLTGGATLVRGSAVAPVAPGDTLTPGDRLETGVGRVEVVLARGAHLLYLDENTAIDILSDDLLRVVRGRVRLTSDGDTPSVSRVDTPAAQLFLREPGEYGVTLNGARTRVAVVRGRVELRADAGSVTLRAGQALAVGRAADSLQPTAFNTARLDSFDRWVERRRASRIDRYESRVFQTRLRPGPPGVPRAPETPETPRVPAPPYGGVHPNTWAPYVPWLIGPICCDAARNHPHKSRLIGVLPIPPSNLLPTAPEPRDDRTDAEESTATPGSLSIVGLRLPATVVPLASGVTGGAQRVIVLPRGGATRSRTASRETPDATPDSGTAGRQTPAGTAPSAPTVIRPGAGVTSNRAPARSSRSERIGSRSERRSTRQP